MAMQLNMAQRSTNETGRPHALQFAPRTRSDGVNVMSPLGSVHAALRAGCWRYRTGRGPGLHVPLATILPWKYGPAGVLVQ